MICRASVNEIDYIFLFISFSVLLLGWKHFISIKNTDHRLQKKLGKLFGSWTLSSSVTYLLSFTLLDVPIKNKAECSAADDALQVFSPLIKQDFTEY